MSGWVTSDRDVLIRRKWAAFGRLGGKCAQCGKLVTPETEDEFDFHHPNSINNGHDKSERWGGGGRLLKPFTEAWDALVSTWEIVCRKECHKKRGSAQLEIDWEAQRRMDKWHP